MYIGNIYMSVHIKIHTYIYTHVVTIWGEISSLLTTGIAYQLGQF